MFDPEYDVPFNKLSGDIVDSAANRELARIAVEKSIVLLRNDGLLPLKKEKIKKIAVIGPNASSLEALLGNYNGMPSFYSTILDGISKKIDDTAKIYYSLGCALNIEQFKTNDPVKSEEAKKHNRFMPDGNIPDCLPEAIMYAKKSDVVILCLGLTAELEGEESFGHEADRPSLKLPGRQELLLEKILETGKPVVLVLINGGPVSITGYESRVDAIVEAFYPGEEAGNAIANILFGDMNPGGRMPYTVVKDESLLPSMLDYSMENRTYRYMKSNVLYPFGFGLSYTSFSYTLKEVPEKINIGDDFFISVLVKNTGPVEGDTVIQVYIIDKMASVRVPYRQLAGFKRIMLQPEEEKEVSLKIESRQLAVIRDDGSCVLEPGIFTLTAGGVQPDEISQKLSKDNIVFHDFVMEGDEKRISY
jgi:beta-glucosidase